MSIVVKKVLKNIKKKIFNKMNMKILLCKVKKTSKKPLHYKTL